MIPQTRLPRMVAPDVTCSYVLQRLTCEVSARHAVEDHGETHSESLVTLRETQLALASFHLCLQILWKILELSARWFPTSRMLKRMDRSHMNTPLLSQKP